LFNNLFAAEDFGVDGKKRHNLCALLREAGLTVDRQKLLDVALACPSIFYQDPATLFRHFLLDQELRLAVDTRAQKRSAAINWKTLTWGDRNYIFRFATIELCGPSRAVSYMSLPFIHLLQCKALGIETAEGEVIRNQIEGEKKKNRKKQKLPEGSVDYRLGDAEKAELKRIFIELANTLSSRAERRLKGSLASDEIRPAVVSRIMPDYDRASAESRKRLYARLCTILTFQYAEAAPAA
jgi:hypothetical protein